MEFYRLFKGSMMFLLSLSGAVVTIAQYKTLDIKSYQQILLAGSVSGFLAHFFVRKNLDVIRESSFLVVTVSTIIDISVIVIALQTSALILLIAGATIMPIQSAIFSDFWERAKQNLGDGPNQESAMRTHKTAGSSAGLVTATMLSLYSMTVSYELAVVFVVGSIMLMNAGDVYMADLFSED